MGWDFNSNIIFSNRNNLHPAEPVSRVSETQPQNGRKIQINNIVAKRKMYIQYKYIYMYIHTYIFNELGRCCQITNITILN